MFESQKASKHSVKLLVLQYRMICIIFYCPILTKRWIFQFQKFVIKQEKKIIAMVGIHKHQRQKSFTLLCNKSVFVTGKIQSSDTVCFSYVIIHPMNSGWALEKHFPEANFWYLATTQQQFENRFYYNKKCFI